MTVPSISWPAASRLASWVDRRRAALSPWHVERILTLDAFLEAAGAAQPLTGFQSPVWLQAVFHHLATAVGAEPVWLAVRHRATGQLAMLLPLEVRREAGVRVARFADFGVCDYNAPLCLPGWQLPSRQAPGTVCGQTLIAAICRSLGGVDVLMCERMLPAPENLLGTHQAILPSRHTGNRLTIIDCVDAYVRSRGKKYRKEAERCYRVLEGEGTWAFKRASTGEEIAEAFTALEIQQAERHVDKAGAYTLGLPRYSAFYRDVLADPSGLAQIFTLTVDGRVIAALLGIRHDTTFTMLRIANGGEAWRHVSPGRLVVIEVMRHFVTQGVKTFDMGIGDYAFKRGFGAVPVPLVDLVIPVSARGIPYAAAVHLRARLRRNTVVQTLLHQVRGGRGT